MKVVLLAFAVVSTLLAAPAHARYQHHSSFTETHALNPDGEITLASINGGVTIRTWDRPEVRIEGEKRAETAGELERIGITVSAAPGQLEIKAEFPRRDPARSGNEIIRAEVRFTLTVPATVRLRSIRTTNGDIAIEGIRGPVNLHTVNGRVVATGLAANTTLETVNGSIRAGFASLHPAQEISTKTVNGSSTITLPRNASLTLQARTVNGSVSCDFPVEVTGRERRTRLDGRIGDGAASLKASSVNGGIRVRQL